MARGGGGGGEWGIHKAIIGKWACSYKKTTLVVCCINIVIGLYVLRSLYSSLYIFSDQDSPPTVFEYTPDQIRKMEESIRIRRSAEPVELIRLVKQLKEMLLGELSVEVELPDSLKLKLTNEILDKFRLLPPNANVTQERGWCS